MTYLDQIHEHPEDEEMVNKNRIQISNLRDSGKELQAKKVELQQQQTETNERHIQERNAEDDQAKKDKQQKEEDEEFNTWYESTTAEYNNLNERKVTYEEKLV